MRKVAVSLVIFDCDGVLVDSEPLSLRILLETIAEVRARSGVGGDEIDEAEAYRAFLGKSLASICELLRRDYGLDVDEDALGRMRARLNAAIREELCPIPGVQEALESLDRPHCVASSSQLERIALSLRVTGLDRYFGDRLFSATMVPRGKPAPDLFLHAAQEMGVAPSDCVVVEDSPAGVVAAREAGMRVLAFTGGSHAGTVGHRERLESLGPQMLFGDMRRLPSLLGELERSRESA